MMNNNYYKVVDELKKILEDIKVVNTVIYARTEEKDLYKNTKFPMVHINPTSTPYENHKMNLFTFEVGAFNIRLDAINDNTFSDNNIIDNHNTTYAILNELLTVIQRDEYYVRMFDVVSISPIRPIFLEDSNGLDGWVVLITVAMINNLEIC